MKSKTLRLINAYLKIIKEQGEDPNAPQQDPNMDQPQDVQDAVDPNTPLETEDEMPLTSQGEEEYISNLIAAALFEPSSDDARTLLNLQNVIQMKRFKNAREEVLPLILSIISPKTQETDIKRDLDRI